MDRPHPSPRPPPPPGPPPATGDHDAAAIFLDVIPDLAGRAASFRVSSEFVDEAVLAAFHRQMESIRAALASALADADMAGIRRQAHSLQGMGGAVGAPEISVVGEELSRAARSNDTARCAVLLERLADWTGLRAGPAAPAKAAADDAPRVPGISSSTVRAIFSVSTFLTGLLITMVSCANTLIVVAERTAAINSFFI